MMAKDNMTNMILLKRIPNAAYCEVTIYNGDTITIPISLGNQYILLLSHSKSHWKVGSTVKDTFKFKYLNQGKCDYLTKEIKFMIKWRKKKYPRCSVTAERRSKFSVMLISYFK